MVPTRSKIRWFWGTIIGMNVAWQIAEFLADNMATHRTEQVLNMMRETVGDDLDTAHEDSLLKSKTAKEALGKHVTLGLPSPGQMTDAIARELDDLKLADLRK